MLKLLVLADDFTGALDTGVQFSKQGAKTQVTTDINLDFGKVNEDYDVVVVDTESRYLSSEDARILHHSIFRRAKSCAIPYIYKKVDSALRGNIPSELKALVEVYENDTLFFIPAYPEINRKVKDGMLYIGDELVSESVFADDPYEPVLESNITKLLSNYGLNSSSVTVSTYQRTENSVLIFDSETENDLQEILNQLKKSDSLRITAGCAGFAKFLAKELFSQDTIEEMTINYPLAVMCGSINPITKKQVIHATKQGHIRFQLNGKQLLERNYWESKSGFENIKEFLESVSFNKIVIFDTFSDETTSSLLSFASEEGINQEEIRFKIGQSIGLLTKVLLESNIKRTILFTGGDTLFQSMSVLGINTITPLSEVTPGVVLSTINWHGNDYQVMTKSGGFGDKDLFEEINNMTKSRRN